MSKPVITVLMAEDEPTMPGLEALEGQAVVREARHRGSWKRHFRKRKSCW